MNEEKEAYMKYCKYDKESKEVIMDLVSVIEKQQAEIEKLRNNNKDLLRKLRNRVKEVKKLENIVYIKKNFQH